MYSDHVDNPVIKQQLIPLQINWNRGEQKALIVNVIGQKADSHFGKVGFKATLEGDQRNQKKQRQRQRSNLQTLRFAMDASNKKNKIYKFSIPYNRGVKRTSDSKLHFLLQMQQARAVLTVVDDYCETKLSIKGGVPQLSLEEAAEKQRRLMDNRIKDKNALTKSQKQTNKQAGFHNDADFKHESDEDS